MKKSNKILLILLLMFLAQACHDELSNVTNVNAPRAVALNTEDGLSQYAKGGIFWNGLGGNSGNTSGGGPAYYPH
ncbi:MAG: hypothetical protein QM734_13645 [Cyclobacteriaceae bacterium]